MRVICMAAAFSCVSATEFDPWTESGTLLQTRSSGSLTASPKTAAEIAQEKRRRMILRRQAKKLQQDLKIANAKKTMAENQLQALKDTTSRLEDKLSEKKQWTDDVKGQVEHFKNLVSKVRSELEVTTKLFRDVEDELVILEKERVSAKLIKQAWIDGVTKQLNQAQEIVFEDFEEKPKVTNLLLQRSGCQSKECVTQLREDIQLAAKAASVANQASKDAQLVIDNLNANFSNEEESHEEVMIELLRLHEEHHILGEWVQEMKNRLDQSTEEQRSFENAMQEDTDFFQSWTVAVEAAEKKFNEEVIRYKEDLTQLLEDINVSEAFEQISDQSATTET